VAHITFNFQGRRQSKILNTRKSKGRLDVDTRGDGFAFRGEEENQRPTVNYVVLYPLDFLSRPLSSAGTLAARSALRSLP